MSQKVEEKDTEIGKKLLKKILKIKGVWVA